MTRDDPRVCFHAHWIPRSTIALPLRPLAMMALWLAATGIGCASAQAPADTEQAQRACIEECQARLSKSEDLSAGPCLSDSLPSGVIAPRTVCDVAHSPRAAVDDERANQCNAFHDGRADHFVEVDPSCAFITRR